MRDMRGFSLLESLIAFALLSVGLLGLAKLTLIGLQGSSAALSHGTAAQLAHEKIADLRQFSTLAQYDALANGSDNITLAPFTYSRSWALVVNGGSVDYTRVTVTVDWSDARGASHSLQLISDIGRTSPVGAAASL